MYATWGFPAYRPGYSYSNTGEEWLDEPDPLPEVDEWLDEPDELPEVDDTPYIQHYACGQENYAAHLELFPERQPCAEWLEEPDPLPELDDLPDLPHYPCGEENDVEEESSAETERGPRGPYCHFH